MHCSVYYPTKRKRDRGEKTTLYEVLHFDAEGDIRTIQGATKAERLGMSLVDTVRKQYPLEYWNGIFYFKFEPPVDIEVFVPRHPEEDNSVKSNDYVRLSKKEKKEFLDAVKKALANK